MRFLILGLVFQASVFFGIGPAISEVTFDWVTVGNPGNPPDTRYNAPGYGSVSYTYRISKYEVTISRYIEFLNSVATSDPNGLYNTWMWHNDRGCKIERSGEDGSYNYWVASDRANRPVNYVSFFDAMRFVNWLENGQPTGAQDASTTEDGVYTISDGVSEVRNPNATYFIPSEDEWYKAAYHKNDGVTGNYWDYPTQNDSVPSNDCANPDPGNNANFYQSGYTIGSPYWTTDVGEFENSESAYGTFDQGGNVREWNEAVIYGVYRGLRGGSYDSSAGYLHAGYRHLNIPTGENFGYFGFRVASISEPSLDADLDDDGDVDGNDFLAWQRGESPNPVSIEDLATWQAEFGVTSTSSSLVTIPESSALILSSLLTFFGIALARCRMRRNTDI